MPTAAKLIPSTITTVLDCTTTTKTTAIRKAYHKERPVHINTSLNQAWSATGLADYLIRIKPVNIIAAPNRAAL